MRLQALKFSFVYLAVLFTSCDSKGVDPTPNQNCDPGYHKENGICVKDANPVDTFWLKNSGPENDTMVANTAAAAAHFKFHIPAGFTDSIAIIGDGWLEGVDFVGGYIWFYNSTGAVLKELPMWLPHIITPLNTVFKGGENGADIEVVFGATPSTPTTKNTLQFGCQLQQFLYDKQGKLADVGKPYPYALGTLNIIQ